MSHVTGLSSRSIGMGRTANSSKFWYDAGIYMLAASLSARSKMLNIEPLKSLKLLHTKPYTFKIGKISTRNRRLKVLCLCSCYQQGRTKQIHPPTPPFQCSSQSLKEMTTRTCEIRQMNNKCTNVLLL